MYGLHPDYLDRMDRHAAAILAAEEEAITERKQYLEREFMKAAAVGDMSAPAPFAKHAKSVGEVVFDGFHGDAWDELFTEVCRLSKTDFRLAVLLQKAAMAWADQEVEI